MKTIGIFIGFALACAIGFVAGSRADRLFDQRSTAHTPALGSNTMPVKYDPASLPIDFREAARHVTPSVVSIDRLQEVRNFGGGSNVVRAGTGSGVIMDEHGFIVTNNHVVSGASEVKVRLPDKRSYMAKVVGQDSRSDLAVLKIEADGLQPIALGDSSEVEVGQWVLAVGNPLGFDNTVSVGVVSSLGRSLDPGGTTLVDAIQTDAAINQGNSGGALTNDHGELIGINSAIASQNGGSIGIGFAIPVNRVRRVVDDIVKLGYVRYAGLGIRFKPAGLDPFEFRQFVRETGAEGIPNGILVYAGPQEASVIKGGAADKAGIKRWDVIQAIDGRPVTNALTLNEILNNRKEGDEVEVTYWSKGQIKKVTVSLQEINAP